MHPLDVRLCDYQTYSMDLVVYIITYNSGTRSTDIQTINPHSRWDSLQASYSLSLVGNLSLLTQVRHSSWQSSATHSYLCVQYFHVSKQWYGYQRCCFLTRTDVDTCDCMWELYGHHKLLKVCTESWHWEKNPLPQQGLEPASVRCLPAFQSDAQPAELCLPPMVVLSMFKQQKLFVVVVALNLSSGHRQADLLFTSENQKKVGSRRNNYTLLPQASALLVISKTDSQIQNGSIYSCFYVTSNFRKFDYKSTERLLRSKQASGCLESCLLCRVNSGRSNSVKGK